MAAAYRGGLGTMGRLSLGHDDTKRLKDTLLQRGQSAVTSLSSEPLFHEASDCKTAVTAVLYVKTAALCQFVFFFSSWMKLLIAPLMHPETPQPVKVKV